MACKRRKVEALFSELKNLIGLQHAPTQNQVRREQFYLAAVAQNLKRLVRFLKHDYATSNGRPKRHRTTAKTDHRKKLPLRGNAFSKRSF